MVVEVNETKSEATDEQGNPIDCGLSDSRPRVANPAKETPTEKRLISIEEAVEDILKTNKALRALKYRYIIRILVEDRLQKQIPEGGIDRACRRVQNTKKLYLPEVEDNREELEADHRGYYANKQEKLKNVKWIFKRTSKFEEIFNYI